ncbi:MAG: poly(A) polymerase [Proteobacteria bacterium]|nr:poly(A) polymerase [Pseudomonadota bacterium]MBU1687026.1 poly(A) polymerase [Pseudomonadota bacterium]
MDLPDPIIIPRNQHSISRKDIDREALKVLYRLRDAGFSAYLVGGGVRDLYLGKTPKDFDISTDARPGQLRNLFRNSRVIGKRFRLVQVFFRGNKIVEVSTLRCRSEYDIEGAEEVLPANNTFGSVAEDAFRRDLTINSLFYEVENFTVIDYVGGVEDLKNGIIRVVGDPDRRIRRDPVRIMRAIRHAARNDFTIEERTWQAILTNLEYLAMCPDSRIRDELFKDMRGGACARWATLAMECGLFSTLLPFYGPDLIPAVKDRLDQLFKVIDRLHGEGAKVDESLLVAMLLLPWAEEVLHLHGAPTRGGEAYQFARTLRDRMDTAVNHLNINRAQKELVTGFLVNLPVFNEAFGDGGWPKWLIKKSYFKDCLRFFQLVREAEGKGQVSVADYTLPEEDMETSVKVPRKRGKRPGRRAPVVVGKAKGGIFGLKR